MMCCPRYISYRRERDEYVVQYLCKTHGHFDDIEDARRKVKDWDWE